MVDSSIHGHDLDEITLTLLHPTQGTAIQSWTFKNKPLIRIGRAPDNELVIQNPVVSRYHATLQYMGLHWELCSLGTNGTYVDNRQITKVAIEAGTVIRLAISGPEIQCCINQIPASFTESTTAVEPPKTIPKFQIDDQKKAHQVAEIAASDYFQNLQSQAEQLRKKRQSEK
jgi:hypothetical protein